MGWRGFGFVHRSRTLFCRAVPNPLYHDSQLFHRRTAYGFQRTQRFPTNTHLCLHLMDAVGCHLHLEVQPQQVAELETRHTRLRKRHDAHERCVTRLQLAVAELVLPAAQRDPCTPACQSPSELPRILSPTRTHALFPDASVAPPCCEELDSPLSYPASVIHTCQATVRRHALALRAVAHAAPCAVEARRFSSTDQLKRDACGMRLPGCVRDMQGWSTSSHNDLTLILPLSLSLSFIRRRAHPNGKLSRSLASHPTNDSVGGSCPPRVPLTPPAAAAGRFVAPSYSYVTCTRARQRKEAGLRVLVY
jgi:hypothetical protein